MKNLTASDRTALIKLASELPQGDETRKAILAGLKTSTFNPFLGKLREISAIMGGNRDLEPLHKNFIMAIKEYDRLLEEESLLRKSVEQNEQHRYSNKAFIKSLLGVYIQKSTAVTSEQQDLIRASISLL